MPETITLSILIVNHDGAACLPDCLQSIRDRVTCDHEVIVVDNDSSDGSVDVVRRAFPGVRVFVSPENLGFARGNGLAALHATGRYLLLLNHDTLLLDDLAGVVAWMDDHPRVGVAGIRMLSADHDYRHSAGRFPTPGRLVRIRTLQERRGPFDDGSFPETPQAYPVDWVEGSFLLTRRSVWNEVGGLDPGYFMYVEDVDYCRAARDAGHGTAYLPGARYVHLGGFRAERTGFLIDGFRRYHRKHSGPVTRAAAWIVLTAGLLARSAVSGVRYVVTRDPEQRTRAVVCWEALVRRGASS